jgi:hypothetical protein
MRLAEQLVKHGLIALGLRRAQARHEDDGKILEPPREVGEKPQRGAVAPVEIVHREQERTLRAKVDGQPVEAVQHREHTLAARLGFLRSVVIPEYRRCGTRRAREQPRALAVLDELRFEQLPHDTEREVALQLPTARRAHA